MNGTEDRLTVEITSMSFGGRGLGRCDGKVVFVPGTVPGDRVYVVAKRTKKSFVEASVEKWLERSKLRKQASCEFFENCGGCQWMHVPYSVQIEWKKDFITSALQRIGGFERNQIDQFSESPSEYHYRNRVKLLGRIKRNGSIEIGYRKAQSHDIVPITKCLIAQTPINEMIKWLNAQQIKLSNHSFHGYEFDLEMRIVEPDDPKLLISLSGTKKQMRSLNTTYLKILSALLKKSPLVLNVQSGEDTRHQFYLSERSFGLSYYTGSSEFQQVNPSANNRLRERILEITKDLNVKTILDLYCGSGNLSLHLAAQGWEVFGIEINPKSIATANYNLKANKVVGRYICQTSQKLHEENGNQQGFDLVIIDPPRAGLNQSLQHIAEYISKVHATHIIYVSCDPNTLARDLKYFKNYDYHLSYIEGFDFFPQTYHVETLAHLKKIPTDYEKRPMSS